MNIIITGATKGIGKAILQRLAEDNNAHQFFVCARNESDLQSLKKEIETKFPHHALSFFACDMGKKEEVKSFADFVLQLTPFIDVLINNTGIYFPGSCFNEEEGVLEKMLNVNLFSAYHLSRAIIPGMIKNKKGNIINMCSIASLKAYDNGGSYSISKFALSGFTKNLREELKPYGIKVAGIYPGATMTDSWKNSAIDANRIMQPDDIAKMVHAYLYLSPQAVMEEIVLRPLLGDV